MLLVFVAAKLVLVALRLHDGHAGGLASLWAPPAMLVQDVWAMLALAIVDAGLVRLGARGVGWALYAAAALYVAVNVPIAREFGTPLTYAFLEAAGGALADSIALHVTTANLIGVFVVIAAALIAPAAIRRAPRRWPALSMLLVPVLLLGPSGVRRCETLGLHRNALWTLGSTALSRLSYGLGAPPPAAAIAPEGAALDLTHLAGAARGRDVIWVRLESTGAQVLAPYGADLDVSPRLTALARAGVIFEAAYTAYPESIKSLLPALCGRTPAPHSAAARYDARALACDALPALLQAAGYRTGLFHSGRFAYLGMRHLVEGRGFEALHDAETVGGDHAVSFGTDDASTAGKLLAWIDEAPERPFFALYMPIAGHHPYKSPGTATRPFLAQSEFDHYRNDIYVGDQALGLLIDGLAMRGRLDRVLWVIEGDHGEAFEQHPGNVAHSLYVYEENVRVPLVVVLPGAQTEAVRAPQVAGAIDVPPTLLALLGLTPPASWQGRSLLAPEPGVARFFTDYSSLQLGLRTGRWKCLVEPELPRVRLFDLESDPGEQRDLAAQEPARAAACDADLRAWAATQAAAVGAGG